MSFFKPYQNSDRNKKVGYKTYPTFYRDPSTLSLAGCPPAEPASFWGRQIKNKKILSINHIISVLQKVKINRGIDCQPFFATQVMRLLMESAAYPFYLIVKIELQHLCKFYRSMTAYRRIANL